MKNLMTFLFTITAIVISTQLKAQAPEIEWQNTIGGSNYEYVQSIQQTTDGGYILGGSSYSGISGDKTEISLGATDYWVVKLDATGSIEWQNTIGGGSDDALRSVQQTTDGGYILGGSSTSLSGGDKTETSIGDGYSDYWVVKLDSIGAIEWQNTIGGSSSDYLGSVQQTIDGGYILGGISSSGISFDKTEDAIGDGYYVYGTHHNYYDYWVVKLNSTGGIEWQNTIGGSEGDKLLSAQQTTDGGYILGGYSSSGISGDKTEPFLGGDYYGDYWVVKLDSSGDIEWQNTIGGSEDDILYSLQQTTDGGYILGGYSYSGISGDKTEANLGIYDYWVIKLDNSGNIEWQNTIGGSSFDGLHCIQQTPDGGFILGGSSGSGISGDKTEANIGPWGYSDYWVVKLDSSGATEWQNTIGGSSEDFLYSLQQTADGGYILGGSSASVISGDKTEANIGDYDYWVVKLAGSEICEIPTGLFADDITPTGASLHWDEIPGAEQYTISLWEAVDLTTVRKKHITTNAFVITGTLTPSTEYGFRVKAVCYDEEITSPFSDAYYFTTAPLRFANADNYPDAQSVNIYPNPAKDEFTIEFNLYNLNQQQINISITNILGEEVFHKSTEMKDGYYSEQININQAAGIYIIKIFDGDTDYEKKIIIE